ncbi:MAG: diguanylate cyclase, partial [Victivallales bacterium]|nr:diguanylate cyclase [Victivallales bacterium]
DNNIAIKVLRYMYTRNSSLEPYKSSIHYLGYTYPVTDFFFEKLNNNLVKLISFLEDHQLISGEFVDRIFSCTQCNSAFLNFREICTECKSPNIEEQQVIHHFRCAYVGPEKDFIREDKLVCPKCKRTLKLVGNDYEKPSDIYSCNNCGNKFQEPDIITECYNCSKKNLPQHLLHPTVKSYKLEELASSVVLYGMNNLFQHDIEKNFPHIKYGSFLKTLETEIERIRRFKLFKSTLCLIKFKNLDKIYLSQGIKANLFIQELSDIIHNVLRRSDLITLYNETIFIILMTHTEIKNAQQAFTRVKENIDKLSEKNLSDKLNFIKINTVEITGVKTSKEIMDELLQNAFH